MIKAAILIAMCCVQPAQYVPYPPGVYGPLPIPQVPPGVVMPRQNYWEYESRPLPNEGYPGRWRYHGEGSPYRNDCVSGFCYRAYRRCRDGFC